MKLWLVAAVVFQLRSQAMPQNRQLRRLHFEPQSGIPLIVHFPEDSNFQDLYLEGDARLVYRGELTKESLVGFP